MARYKKIYLDLDVPRTPATLCDFLGWDDLAQGQPCTEATIAADLGKGMSAADLARFTALNAGTGKTHDGIEYQREW